MTAILYPHDVLDWAARARHRDRLVYHVGDVAFERAQIADGQRIGAVADAVATLHRQGVVLMVQRRRPDGRLDYIAQRARR